MNIKKWAIHFRGPILILLVVCLANILFISGFFKSNPIDQFSGSVTYTHVGLYGVYSTIDPNNAYTTQALGHAGAEDILHGNLPWWNSNEQVGAPLAGGMQSAALFLPFSLLLAFSTGVLWFHIALELVAGFATYYLLRRLKCSELVSVVGGILFALNGTFAWFGSANFNPVAFLPLLILGIEIALDKSKEKKAGGWVLVALALAFSVYAGFPEAAFLDGFMAGIWFIVRAIQQKDNEWLRFCVKVTGGALVGILLAAPILIAFKDYLPFANIGGHSGALSVYSLPHKTLPALFMPYIYGPIFMFSSYDHTTIISQFWDNVGGYLTLSTVFLAIVGIVTASRKNRAIVYMLGVFSLIVMGRIYGFPGLTKLINLIPEMHRVAIYRYVDPTLELAVIILAMFGLEYILKTKKINKKKILIPGVAIFVLVALLMPWAINVDHNLYLAPHHRLWLVLSVVWSLGSIVAVVITALYLRKYARFLLPVIILFDAVVMYSAPQLSAPRSTALDLKPLKFIQANLGNERFYSVGYVMPNYGSYYGVASINTNNMPVAQSWTDYITAHLNSNVNPLQEFTGIDKLNPDGLTPLEAFLINLPSYEKVNVKYVVTRKGTISQEVAQQYSLLKVYDDNFFQIYQLPNVRPYFQVINGQCVLSSSGSRVELETVCAKSSTLQRNELYAPGWTADINGTKIVVSKSGNLFQKINLPKGSARVEFNYTPPQIILGYVAFASGLLLIAYPVAKKLIIKSK